MNICLLYIRGQRERKNSYTIHLSHLSHLSYLSYLSHLSPLLSLLFLSLSFLSLSFLSLIVLHLDSTRSKQKYISPHFDLYLHLLIMKTVRFTFVQIDKLPCCGVISDFNNMTTSKTYQQPQLNRPVQALRSDLTGLNVQSDSTLLHGDYALWVWLCVQSENTACTAYTACSACSSCSACFTCPACFACSASSALICMRRS